MSGTPPLLLRYGLVNVVALGLVGAAWIQGWLEGFGEPRTWILSLGILAVFLWGLGLTGFRLFHMNQSLGSLATGTAPGTQPYAKLYASLLVATGEERALRTEMARMALGNQMGAIRYIANSLVFLGLIGTVIGFIIGLTGIDASAAKDADKIAPMISELILGMSVALYTTLLGAVLNIWLNVNLRILADGMVHLLSEMVEKSTVAQGASAAKQAATA